MASARPPTGPEASSSNNAAPSSSKPAAAPPPPRPIPPMLRPLTYMGIPEGVLRWKPRLPSRNWTIFLTVTGSLTSLYFYDRRQCKVIRQEYIDQVQHLAQQPMHPSEHPRKVRVFAAKSPGDDDEDKSLLYFKKYVKPILAAAAIDYELINGTRHGGLAKEIRERIFSRRRQLLQLEPWGTPTSTSSAPIPDPLLQGILPFSLSPQQQLEHELNGAVILVGRPAFKEWAFGMKAGWTSQLPPTRQDLDEGLAKELMEDDVFDEKQDASSPFSSDDSMPEADGAGAPLESRLPSSSMSFNPAFQMQNKGQHSPQAPLDQGSEPRADPRLLEPPAQIPAQPPVYYVDYTNLVGFKNVPRKLYGFFNQRERVRRGGEAGVAIALGDKNNAREFDALFTEYGEVLRTSPPQGGDLDWGLESEAFYPRSFQKTLMDMEKSRKAFYENLHRRLEDTRSYVRGQRELTVTEKKDPPTSESKLREERFNREREWRNLEFGYAILKPESGVEWHKAFIGSVRVLREGMPQAEDQEQMAV